MSIERLTRGIRTGSTLRPMRSGIVPILTLLPAYGLSESDSDAFSIKNFDVQFGRLVCESLDAGGGIKVTFTPNFPSNYRRYFAILRGRTEYKDGFAGTYKLIYETNEFVAPTDPIVVEDLDVEEGVFYYYTAITLVGDSESPARYEYNPNTCKALAYSFSNFGHINSLYDNLPDRWKELDTDNLTYNFLSVFAEVLDSIKTDIDAQVRFSKSIWEINEKNLEALASIIGWEVNREFNVDKQRKEVENAYAVYKAKGRHHAIQFLIQTITGWDSTIEDGYYRLAREGNERTTTVDWSDTTKIYKIGHPWLQHTQEYTATGVSSQDVVLEKPYVDRVVVSVTNNVDETDNYTEVESADLPNDGSSLFAVNSLGDGLYEVEFDDDSMPIPNTAEISYVYGGDPNTYTYEYPMLWKNDMGHRFILTQNDENEPLNNIVITKIFKAINYFKASYAVYNLLVSPFVTTEEIPLPEDSESDFVDVITHVTFLRSNTLNHRSNTLGYFSAPI